MPTFDEIQLQKLLRPFEENRGIVNTNNAIPMIDTFSLFQQNQIPLVDQIIAENLSKTTPMDFTNAPQDYYPTTGIIDSTPARKFEFQKSAYEDDDEEQVEYLTEPTGIKKLLQYLPFGEKSLLRRGFEEISNLIPRRDPRAMAMQNFYGSRFGLTPTGSVASGIMAGYNPVSGFGRNKNIGLARAMQKRIERIQETLKKKDSQQLRDRVSQLRDLQRQEIRDRSDRGESLSDIGKSTFSGKGMAFEKGAGKVR